VDYFSFEDVMSELELGEEELKRMVSEGELRAFRDENKMKFKKEDVESLKKGRITEPTIILPSTPSSETTDETVLDLDIGNETAALSDTSAQLAAVGKGRREEEDLIVPSEEVGSDQEETFIEEDTDTGLSTEPLKLADETAEETVAAEAVEEESPPPPPRKRSGMTGVQRKVTARIPVAVEQEIERKRAHPVWTIFIFLALLAALYSGFFFVDMVRLESGQASAPSDMTKGAAEFVLKKFWEDSRWRNFHERKFEGKAPPFNDPADPRIKHQSYNKPTVFSDPEYAANMGGGAAPGGAAPAPAPAPAAPEMK
jgi:hypothetical protein